MDKNRQFETTYLNLLGRLLDGLATRFTRDQERLAQNYTKKNWIVSLFGVNPFTEGSYLLCLKLALVYPWLAFFVAWLLGSTGEFSGLVLLADGPTIFERLLVLFTFTLLIWSFLKFLHNPGITSLLYLIVAGAGAFAFAYYKQRCTTSRTVAQYWIIFNIFYLVSSIACIIWLLGETNTSQSLTLLVFIILLPLVNAFMDWLSLGFTRGFLYAIRQRTHSGMKALKYVLLDVALAIAFLIMIMSLTVFLLTSINAVAMHWNGQVLMDLQILFDGLAEKPMALEYAWIHFMMLSTLIPTLIHFTVAGAAAIMVFPNQWRQSILNKWEERGDAQTGALWYVTLVPALGLAAPVFALWLLYKLISAHGGWFGYCLLDWARTLSTVFDPLIG